MLEEGKYPVPVDEGGVSGSDSAAEVIAVGSGVAKFSVGDHVAVASDLLRFTIDDREMEQIAIGGEGTGTLQEYVIFEEKVLVKLPMHLSWEEVCESTALLTSVVADMTTRHRLFQAAV
jgi:NADPH:quinone reductase-like Zn-dependent oxidoreductase